MNCRHCSYPLEHTFLDLGTAPPSNAYLSAEQLNHPEIYLPLKVLVCKHCWLVQTQDYSNADDLFTSDYAYFSSTSTSWLKHAEIYCDRMISELNLGPETLVLEIACNDGYLLKNFVTKNIPCFGVEPTESTAQSAKKLGISVIQEFFSKRLGRRLAEQGQLCDLIIGNNVYAHVPEINDFTAGLKLALKKNGVITLEFPHLMRLIAGSQFDTIYHEHFSYLSLNVVYQIFANHGLRIWDVEELATHGGSLRIYACHDDDARPTETSVQNILSKELAFGLCKIGTYIKFQQTVESIKNQLLEFLIENKSAGVKIVAYGAAAKGNTLLNFAGIHADLLPVVVDASKHKQNKYLPGSRIPIQDPSILTKIKPQIVLILPWNIKTEIIKGHGYIASWGGRFLTLQDIVKPN